MQNITIFQVTQVTDIPASHGDYITYLYFKKTITTQSMCTPEGRKGSDVVNKDRRFYIQ